MSLMFIILMGKENYFFLWSQAAEGIGATCPDVEQTCCVMSQNGRIGRQTPQHYEVLEGLESGERVVTSGYEAFKDNEVLVLT